MAKKRHTAEDIINKEVCRKLVVTEQTYYRWRNEYRHYPHIVIVPLPPPRI